LKQFVAVPGAVIKVKIKIRGSLGPCQSRDGGWDSRSPSATERRASERMETGKLGQGWKDLS
jgi:hypothetical protein